MILWSIEPVDRIFPTEMPKMSTLPIDGGFIEGSVGGDGFTVSRLVSTDLKNYLRTEYSPGYTRKL